MSLESDLAQALEPLLRRVVREELRRSTPETLTVEQASAYTGRAMKTIYGWIRDGLASKKKGRRVYVRRDDLDAWLARGETPADRLVASLRRTG